MDEQRQYLAKLRQSHLRRLRELENQAATFGVSTPPHITTEIEDIRAQIAQLDAQLGPVAPRILRYSVPDFVGREQQIDQIVQSLHLAAEGETAAAISVIRGMGGIGKTELAYAVAQRLAPFFPDGQVLIELHGERNNRLTSALALQAVIRAFAPDAQFPDNLTEQMFCLKNDASSCDNVNCLSSTRPKSVR
jgi:hypothetical protein